MRYRGTHLIEEKELGTGLASMRNKPGWYLRAEWGAIQCLKPYELFVQADGSIMAQNMSWERSSRSSDLLSGHLDSGWVQKRNLALTQVCKHLLV
jgi:hypothetical protein